MSPCADWLKVAGPSWQVLQNEFFASSFNLVLCSLCLLVFYGVTTARHHFGDMEYVFALVLSTHKGDSKSDA
eukprot:4797645-Amphidinium_carterae.2